MQNSTKISILTSVLLVAISSSFVGCSSSAASFTTERSVGELLTELNDAHQKGIVNDKEYARLKKAIIKKHD